RISAPTKPPIATPRWRMARNRRPVIVCSAARSRLAASWRSSCRKEFRLHRLSWPTGVWAIQVKRVLFCRKSLRHLDGPHLRAMTRELRLQFAIPIKIVCPTLMQIIRRKFAPMLAQFGDSGRMRPVARMHMRLGRHAPALEQVAGAAGGDDILPSGAP